MKNPKQIAQSRPAEVATPPAMIFAILICKALGVEDLDTLSYVAVAVAFVPAGVTWLVELVRG